MDEVEKSNPEKGNFENVEQEYYPLRAQHNHGDTAEEVCLTSLQNGRIFGESSAQADGGAAMREHQEGQCHHIHKNRLEMQQKLKEKEEEIKCLLNTLADAEMLTVFVSKSWMDAYKQLNKTFEDDANNMVAAINVEWQKWWAYREQETAEQFQTQRENMQWHMDDMAVRFNTELDSMRRHNLEMSAYFRSEMESLQQHMVEVVQEKDELIAKLRRENYILGAENGEMLQSHSFKYETPEEQQSLHALEVPLKVDQDTTSAFVNVAEVADRDPIHDAQ
ncbi:uncharacterized protein LOC133396497 isoform X1 [Phycodurus eques]|uniref:uncharacterized protein LOC133396497 isoform X1 n=1 Tax=Phycodurus eques TaxID=693459 RepID=UPI002ACE323D|nr:uncharacterized protein LOC133396497 isoform X1 [Phycodurus eques]